MNRFNKNQNIGPYQVTFPIKEGSYAETYRVKDSSGKNYFLKLYNYAKLHRTQFDENGDVMELQISKLLNHPNLTAYHDSGELLHDGQKFAYIVYEFISGETLSQKTTREQRCTPLEAKQYVLGILEGVKFIHNLPNPVIHNELTTQNVMLDLRDNSVKIIDFGYARYLNQSNRTFQKEGLNPFYLAPETFNGIFTKQSDLYSVGAMLFHLLFGIPPYFVDISRFQSEYYTQDDIIISEKNKPLRIPDMQKMEAEEQLLYTMSKALAPNVDNRFQSAEEFIAALKGEVKVAPPITKVADSSMTQRKNNIKKGNGFADVAGMTELKEQLQSDVIDLLQQPEQAKALGLSLPNGLLFYGPPGCGKTYFAEKFAEEIGCNYMYIKCSDVASPFIHGGQEKIAAVFNEARENAPTILFFDEIEAMITDRSKHNNVSESGEVNEFLAQLNNCGADGVIVIGATNNPLDIDTAALRAGRLEYKYYIPVPDFETRKKLFEIHLKDRKTDFGIDYDWLALHTENFISADIKFVVDNAARHIFRRHQNKITMAVLQDVVSNAKSTISADIIQKHEQIRDQFEGNKIEQKQNRIGFI